MSPDWTSFIVIARSIGHSDQDALALLKTLKCPPRLISIHAVIKNLAWSILPFCQQIRRLSPTCPNLPDELELAGWQTLCQSIHLQESHLIASIRGAKKGPNRHGRIQLPEKDRPYTFHGRYISIWTPCQSTQLELQFDVLKAMLLLAEISLTPVDARHPGSQPPAYNAQLALRHLSGKGSAALLALFPQTPMPLVEYSQYLKEIQEKNRHLMCLSHYIGRALQQQPARTLTRKKGVTRRLRSDPCPPAAPDLLARVNDSAPARTREDDFPGANILAPRSLPQTPPGKEKASRNHDRHRLLIVLSNPDRPKKLNYYQEARRIRRAMANIAVQNNSLTYHWQNLTDYEAAVVIEAILRIPSGTLYKSENPTAVSAALAVMLWYSVSLENLSVLKIFHGPPHADDEAGLVIFPQKKSSVKNGHIPLFSPEDKALDLVWQSIPCRADESAQVSQDEYPVSGRCLLPIPPMAADILRNYLRTVSRDGSATSGLFPEAPALVGEIKALLTEINARHRTRITPARIADCLIHRSLHITGGDIALSMLWSGRYNETGRSKIHYTTVRQKHLWDIFTTTCLKLTKDIGPHLNVSSLPEPLDLHRLQPTPLVSANDKNLGMVMIGARHRPIIERLQSLVEAMQRLIVQQELFTRDWPSFSQWHKAYAVYTLLMMRFAAAVRPTNFSGFFPLGLNVPGLVMVSDKDDENRNETRIVWLPPACQIQLDHYFQYLAWMQPRVQIANPILHRHLSSILAIRSQHPYKGHRVRTGLGAAIRTCPDPFFLFENESTKTEPLSPGKLTNFLQQLKFNLRPNAQRSHLRSRLLERCCPAEIIDALLGHALYGQEPWGPSSALSVGTYVAYLQQHIPPIVEELGWRPIPFDTSAHHHSQIPVGPPQASLF